jgi:hypothetical protein
VFWFNRKNTNKPTRKTKGGKNYLRTIRLPHLLQYRVSSNTGPIPQHFNVGMSNAWPVSQMSSEAITMVVVPVSR